MDATSRRTRGPALSVLGGFALRDNARVLDVPSSAQRLVALLAVHGPADRRSVAGRLWPDARDERAQGSLRSALWRLQQVHPDVVTTGGERLVLAPRVDVDLQALTRAAGLLLAPDVEGEVPDLPALADLLPGWDEPWVTDERERVRQLGLHALEARGRLLLARGAWAAALDAALRAVAADPLRESAHALVVQVHLAEGNRVEGWRQVERCRAVLRAELGIDASPKLLALAGASPAG